MSNATVGSLNIEVQMSLNKIQGQMDDLTRSVKSHNADMNSSWASARKSVGSVMDDLPMVGLKLAVGGEGMRRVFSLIRAEVMSVINNIENIPGVPGETVGSIMRMKDELHSARGEIDTWIAGGIAYFSDFATAVGAGAAAVIDPINREKSAILALNVAMGNFGALFDDPINLETDALSKLLSVDDALRAKDPSYDAKVAAARLQLVDATQKLTRAGMDQAAQIADLRAEAERYDTFAHATNTSQLAGIEAITKAQNLRSEADKMALNNATKIAAAQNQLAEAAQKLVNAGTDPAGQITNLLSEAARYDAFAQASGASQLDRIHDETKAYDLRAEAITKAQELHAKADKEALELQKQLTAAQDQSADAYTKMINRGVLPRDLYDSLQENVSSAETAYNKIFATDATPAAQIKANKDLAKSYDEMEPVMGALTRDSEQWLTESETGAERYTEALKNINKEASIFADFAPHAAAAAEKAWETLTPVGKEMTSIWSNFSDASSAAFAEMLVDGRSSFSDLVKTVEKALIEMAVKLAVINPILKGVFGGAGGTSSLETVGIGSMLSGLMGFASGGRPEVGQPAVFGEKGPELWIPDSAGTVIPNSALTSGNGSGLVGGGGAGGLTVVYNITSGVTKNELGPILQIHAQKVYADIVNKGLRGGTPARLLGR
ncbi:MAG TPA: phage tail tape measure C-terminal domain-containing protein [Verrucomicrobiae bacterium]|nr:phage tail tape measure C-terminal domain-containing protein [Verrucomicrobiae bacterium]